MLDVKTKELIAIGASVSTNSHSCVLFHIGKARELDIDSELIRQAFEVGKMVRKGAADQMDNLLTELSKE